MIKSFECISADPASIAVKLTNLMEFCEDIKIHSCMPAQTQMQQMALVLLIECRFIDEWQHEKFEENFRPKIVKG